MRSQLFKGTYGVLLLLAVVGLFLMLRRGAGDGYSLIVWLGLVALGAAGLVFTNSDALAVGGTVCGLLTTLYLKFSDVRATGPGVAGADAASQMRVDLALGVYVLMSITVAIIWRARRRMPSS